MQNNKEELKKAADDIRKEESYGGFQYKRDYDEYKKELIAKQVKKQGRWLNVLIIMGFVVLLSALAVLITDTILKTKGSSFTELLRGQSTVTVMPHKSELSEKAIGELSSRYTVTIDADGKTGSGIVLTEDGYIATCFSLINNASSVSVKVKSGNSFTATVAGYDELCDTAVLKIEPSADLKTAEIGNSRTIEVGQNVYCLTSPFSQLIKMSVTGSGDGMFIVTEPGCDVCGSPLLNSYGQVVGICTDDLGRVLHIDSMLPSIKKMLNGSSVSIIVSDAPVYISMLDVYTEAVTEKQAEIYKIPVGCFITSAHASRQFKHGDIIVEVNNKPITGPESLSSALSEGAIIKLYRNNAYIELTLE